MASTTTTTQRTTTRSIPQSPSSRLVRGKPSISGMASVEKKPSPATSTSSSVSRTPSTRLGQYGARSSISSQSTTASSSSDKSLMPPPSAPTHRASVQSLRTKPSTVGGQTTASAAAASRARAAPGSTQSGTSTGSSLQRSSSTTVGSRTTAGPSLGRSASVRGLNSRSTAISSTVSSVREEVESRTSASSGSGSSETPVTRTTSLRTRPSSLIGPSKTASSTLSNASSTATTTTTTTLPSTGLKRAPLSRPAPSHRRAISTSESTTTTANKRPPFNTLKDVPGPKEPVRPTTSYTSTTLPSQTIDPLTTRHQLHLLRYVLLHATSTNALDTYTTSAKAHLKEHYFSTAKAHSQLQQKRLLALPQPFPKSVETEEHIQILSESATSLLTLSQTEIPPLRAYFAQWYEHHSAQDPDEDWSNACANVLRKLQSGLAQLTRIGEDASVLSQVRKLGEGLVEEVVGWGQVVKMVGREKRRRVENVVDGLDLERLEVEVGGGWVPAWRR